MFRNGIPAGITYSLIEKGAADRIPIVSMHVLRDEGQRVVEVPVEQLDPAPRT